MTPKSKPIFALLGTILAACASSGGTDSMSAPVPEATAEAPTTTAADPAPVAMGAATFTDDQADRGRDLFRAQCTECHYSSEFSDSQFKFKWSRRSAGNLYNLIQSSMPETAPGSLTPEEAVSVVTYIMRMNGFEPGAAELPADRAVLDGISLASIRGE